MNTAELLEHGGTIGGSWLAQKGRWVLWALEQIGGLEQLETVLDEAGYGWCERTGSEPCTAECWATPDGWTETAGAPVAASDEQRMAKFREDRDAARRIQQDLTERWLGFAWPPREPGSRLVLHAVAWAMGGRDWANTLRLTPSAAGGWGTPPQGDPWPDESPF